MNLDDLDTKIKSAGVRTPQKVIVFGESKTGKTQLVGELAKHGFTLHWFDLENGYETLLKLPHDAKKNINLFHIPDTWDVPQAQDTMRRVFKNGKHSICVKHGRVSCLTCTKEKLEFSTFDNTNLGPKDIVVIDSGTQLSQSAMAKAMSGLDSDTKPEWEHFGKQGFILSDVLGRIQAAPYHVVMITHITEAEQLDGKEKLFPAGGTRNFSRNMPRFFGHSIYLFTSNKLHKGASSSTYSTQIATGSRSEIELEKSQQLSLMEIFNAPQS